MVRSFPLTNQADVGGRKTSVGCLGSLGLEVGRRVAHTAIVRNRNMRSETALQESGGTRISLGLEEIQHAVL